MGTTCHVFVVDRDADDLREAERWVGRLAARLTRFSPNSELSQFNSSPGCWIAVSDELHELLLASLRAYYVSAGLVNVAVLPSVLAAGYTRPLAEATPVATLDAARPVPPLPEILRIRTGYAWLAPGAGIDLGGIAKGWIADRLCMTLAPNALVNLGGDLRAVGDGPRGEGWAVGFGRATLGLRNQGAATSSIRRRRWGAAHHLIDPRTGRPAVTGVEEVSIVAMSGFEAEVAAKTALLLGPELAPAYLAVHALAWWMDGPHDS
jgi:thiamine biosynthesis lipoprotein